MRSGISEALTGAYKGFLKGLEYLLYVLLLALVLIVTANIVGRGVFNHSLPWSDELARFL